MSLLYASAMTIFFYCIYIKLKEKKVMEKNVFSFSLFSPRGVSDRRKGVEA